MIAAEMKPDLPVMPEPDVPAPQPGAPDIQVMPVMPVLPAAETPTNTVEDMPSLDFGMIAEFIPAHHFPFLYFTINMLDVAIYSPLDEMEENMKNFFENYLWVFTPQLNKIGDHDLENLVSAEARQLFAIWGFSDFSSLDDGHVGKFLVEVMHFFNKMHDRPEKMWDIPTMLWILENDEDYLDLFEIKIEAMGFNKTLIRGDPMALWAELGHEL